MRAVVILVFLIGVATLARAQIVQFSGAAIPPSCPASVLDTYAASPGAWTAAYSLRKLRSAYAGNAVQLENSNTTTTQDVGFSGCNPASSGSFCQTATLSVGASTANVAFPAGSVIHVFNEGPSSIFWAAGNGSVLAHDFQRDEPARQWRDDSGDSKRKFAGLHSRCGRRLCLNQLQSGTTRGLFDRHHGGDFLDRLRNADCLDGWLHSGEHPVMKRALTALSAFLP